MAAAREQLELFTAPPRRRKSPRSMSVQQMRSSRIPGLASPDRVTERFDPAVQRPRTRAECGAMPRPCPYVGCRDHLYLEVNPDTGSIKFNFPDLEPWELEETCARDVGDRGGMTLDGVGRLINLTRERTRQIEVNGLRKLERKHPELRGAIPGDEP